jgi:hypothetical protein
MEKKLTRRPDNDPHRKGWLVYYGDVRVGHIGIRAGVPNDVASADEALEPRGSRLMKWLQMTGCQASQHALLTGPRGVDSGTCSARETCWWSAGLCP